MFRRNISGRTVPQTGSASYNKSTVQLALSALGNLKIVEPTSHGRGLSEPKRFWLTKRVMKRTQRCSFGKGSGGYVVEPIDTALRVLFSWGSVQGIGHEVVEYTDPCLEFSVACARALFFDTIPTRHALSTYS